MKRTFIKKFVSAILASTMTVSLIATLPVTANDNLDDNIEYYLSLDTNSEEYQNWKANYIYDNVDKNEIYNFALSSLTNGISNEYIEITLNGRNYALGTTGGNPESPTDNNRKLLYGYPGGGTSYTTIQIDGINNIFVPETTTYRDNSIISTDVIGDVVVTQYLNIVHNQYTNRDDVAEFFYTAENTGAENHTIGIRIMFDTMLGNNDSAPFRLPNIGDVTTETDLRGDAVPEFWQAFDSLTSPSVIAQGTLNIDKDSTPDRVRFTNWGTASSNQWDYTRSEGSYNGDSAVCLYWNPKSIEPNRTMSCKTYYGLSSLQQDNTPPLAVAISGATKLEVVEDENGHQSYAPNPFTVTAYIQNIGTGTAYNTNVELNLPECMSIIDGTNIISLGDIPVSGNQTQVSWKVKVDSSPIDKIETYGIIVTADNAETKTLDRQIEIPAIGEEGVELSLDRSVISDNNSLNLKFKIKNTSDFEIELNQLRPRYYFLDESPKAVKIFECYSVYINPPYSQINNSLVTMNKYNLDTLHNMANSYYEFSFNTDEKLLPNQEIIIDGNIHNASWSKIVSSNDYSSVGDDSPALNGYIVWEYMPIFSSENQDKPLWGKEPEIDPDGLEPDLMVELDPNAVNGKGYMNLNIRITNNGLLPIDLGQTEIKYYYTNDRGLPQSVSGNYIGGRIDNNFIGITDKSIIETVKMDVRKRFADTYVSIKFAEDTGILYFEDYIDLNIQVYNTDWKAGDYTLENDYSYQEEEQEFQTFSLIARSASNTSGMRNAQNIVVNAACADISFNGFFKYLFGIEPEEPYEPKFALFKVGEGSSTKNTIEDYNAAFQGLVKYFNAVPYDYESAMNENISHELVFNEDNLKAILESDIAYISGHGFDGGVIPIYKSSAIGLKNYSKILSTDKNIGRDFHHYNGPEIDINNVFSLNMKDHNEDNINENLKWLIVSACSQLSDKTDDWSDGQESISRSSLDRWISLLKSNSNMKGMLGYYGTAPGADNEWTPDNTIISNFLESSADGESIYNSWLKANSTTAKKEIGLGIEFDYTASQKSGLLVKGSYDKESLYKSLSDNSEINYSKIYLYKFSSGVLGVSSDKENVTNKYPWVISLNNYAQTYDIQLPDELIFSTVSREVYDDFGNYIETEIIEYIVDVEDTSNYPIAFSYSSSQNLSKIQTLRINAETQDISVLQ